MATTPNAENLVGQSTFIFRGTVVKTNASLVSAMPAGPNTAIVKVDQVLRAPEVLGSMTGDQVTVQFKAPTNVQVGQQRLFFTVPVVFSDTVAVQETGQLQTTPPDVQAMSAHVDLVSNLVKQLPDKKLQEHALTADAVVTGTVTAVKPVVPPPGSPVTEHDPKWHEATLKVESVERGHVASDTVTVLFANSKDIAWYTSPKFTVGQKGVFVLHSAGPVMRATTHFLATDPLDYHPTQQRERIRSLVHSK